MRKLKKIFTRDIGQPCPLCGQSARKYSIIQDVAYFECRTCDFLFADPDLLRRVDAGEPLRRYDSEYWRNELSSARERSFGSSLARAAEAILYCRIPIRRFIDVGTGPGYLLDALSTYLPSCRDRFYGVEKFPPAQDDCTTHENYLRADLRDVGMQFECGVCVEVIEHLTPAMADHLASALASASVPGSLFLFNTGLTEYVRKEDPGYLDPYGRGHITSWSTTSARKIFEPHGFLVHAVAGKTWAFVVERPLPDEPAVDLRSRVWKAPAENRRLLTDPAMGEVMYILGRESAHAY
ncbi:methyltransferase domain-containing protein [Lysobacter soli]|uniref:methyltransferase domain-containing protein n=1 Tax=Lysobacter soli TaxID=453783 RepID=UPI0012EE52CB|nr:methyltransferase domain-containing protein [Lysobacter soli]QGW64059.1 methyltransferase domain-containing protein [Lysobacter soli]